MSNQDELDNHANQLNPNNEEFWHSRGVERIDDDDEDAPSEEEHIFDPEWPQ